MYLSRVDLNGFKSFADKTSFDLDKGITAILGPNGCGKSNVVDAIKWVLGESSAKNLRGSQMLDVIFAGSEGRKASGMAEVSLHFNNEDGTLPIEYNEVCVTRRLFRSGESEYLINGQLCRKRDIRDLFLDTGVGMSAYSFIEQGRVEALLQAKPAERRMVLEEAAGISKYKQRRKETLSRLDRTNQYLYRVNDIVDEIEKNIRRVSRQAQNARRWQSLKNELDQVRTLHYTRSYQKLLDNLEKINQEKSEVQELYSREAASQAEATNLITELTNQEMDLSVKVESSEKEFREIQEELNQVQIELATASERRENLASERAEAEVRAKQLAERLESIKADMEKASSELEGARTEYEKYNNVLSGQDGRRGELQSILDNCEQRVDQLRKDILNITERRNEIRAEEVRAESRESGLQERLQQLATREQALVEREAQTNARLEELREKLATVSAGIEELNNIINNAKEEERRLRESASSFDQKIAELSNRISALESRRSTLQDLEDEMDGAFAGVKAVLKARERGESMCSDIEGMVADLMVVPQEYAIAIETTIGGQAQDIVVKTARGAQDCINYLKNNHAGRATFLPLDRIRPRQELSDDLIKLPGVIGEAFDLVEFKEQHMPVMEYLLNGVLIVENLSVARELSGGKARGVRIVTLDGDIINPHGAMTGGQGNRQRAGLIARKAEKDALGAEIEERKAQIDEAIRAKEEALNKANSATNNNSEVEAQLAEALKVGREYEMELSVKESEARRVEQDRAEFDAEAGMLNSEIGTLSENKGGFEQEKVALTEKEKSSELELEETLNKMRQARCELDALGESLAGVRESRAQAHSMVSELERRLEMLGRDKSERDEELAHCTSSIERSGQERENIVNRLEDLKDTEKDLLNRRDNAHTGDVGDREKLKGIREQLEQYRNQEKASQRRINEANEALGNFRIRENEINLKMQNIAEKAEVELEITDLKERAETFREEHAPVISALTGEEIEQQSEDDDTQLKTPDGTPILCLTDEQLGGYIREVEVKIERIGPVNMCAIEELAELEARAEFLKSEQDDITEAANNLLEVIEKLNGECNRRFEQTFETVRENFQDMFRFLFGGGRADLVLEQPEEGQDLLDCGIDIIARPPGKEPKSISLLSGGEKALCAVALLFAIFRSKPSPFCILDEVDGPLDESNIDRFMSAVRNFTDETQFILISHAKRTMSMTDTIYGVTQQHPGVSTKYSLRFKDATRRAAPEDGVAVEEAEAKRA